MSDVPETPAQASTRRRLSAKNKAIGAVAALVIAGSVATASKLTDDEPAKPAAAATAVDGCEIENGGASVNSVPVELICVGTIPASTTTTSTAPSTSTSSTSPASSSTVAPTTTSPTTTSPTTSTTNPTTTTAPSSTSSSAPPTTLPSTGNFVEPFTTPGGVGKFDIQLHTALQTSGQATSIAPTFVGEHNTADPCGDPTTHRTITAGQSASAFIDASGTELVWYCVPNNDPLKGHMMTGLDTLGIAYLSFSPKQTFTDVKQVCWDQNMNDMGGAKWINVFVVPVSDVAAHGGNLNYLSVQGEPFEASPMQYRQFVPANSFHYTWLRGSTFAYQGRTNTMDFWNSADLPGPYKGYNNDPAPRFTTCLNSGGQMIIHRPDGRTDSRALGASFPTGPVRVIFQDASYNPTKHNGFVDHLTWHWDNIVISVG